MFNEKKIIFDKLVNEPLILVDVGFKDGIQDKWLKLKNNLKIIGFEPNQSEYERLVKKNIPNELIFNTALWNCETEIDFYITKAERLCSCLNPNRKIINQFPENDRFDVVNKIPLQANTLDNIFDKYAQEAEHIINPDFIKLDTQGTELYILEGMKKILERSIFGVEIEVNFIELYQNRPLFGDIDSFLRANGFNLMDLKKYYWRKKSGIGFDSNKKGQVIHGDALYFREPSYYIDSILSDQDDNIKDRLLKSLIISLLSGYTDVAFQLIDKSYDKNILDDEEFSSFKKLIKKNSQINYTLPDFKGKNTLSRIFNTLFDTNYNGWAKVDNYNSFL